ncbi:MAG TPA: MFS transporter [Polaromonas sp.]|uniref:MFS transporter n=1 Tax=Polaromonas sp. UBA4122 TaxID=1947074 RepID=UPI000EC9A87B|nr:MFS transporter [Polaromonas sp. UBA4122]HAL37564.1 MFS transporter [Polaromonas sp.]
MKSSLPRSAAAIYVLLFLMALINYLDRIALSVAAKPIAAEFDLSPIQMGYLFSSFLWTYLAFVIPAGILADRYGAKRVSAVGMSVWSLATIATGISLGFAQLMATRLVMGAGEATTYPSGNKVIREQVPAKNRGFATAVFNSGAYAGPALGALLFGWLVATFGWRIAFMVAGAIGFVWLAAWLIWFRHESELTAARTSTTAEEYTTTTETSKGVGLKGLLRSRSMWGIALTQGCAVYSQYLFLTWLPSYLQASKGMDLTQAAIYTALPYGCAVLLGIVLGKFSDKILKPGDVERGKRRAMIASMLLCSSVILLAPLVNNIWLIVAMLAISLTGLSTAVSLNFALANDLLVHTADAAKANSLTLVGGNTFGILAPILTGYMVAATNSYTYAFATAGILLILGAVISLVFTRSRIGTVQSGGMPASSSVSTPMYANTL